jgi:hypothetical protein
VIRSTYGEGPKRGQGPLAFSTESGILQQATMAWIVHSQFGFDKNIGFFREDYVTKSQSGFDKMTFPRVRVSLASTNRLASSVTFK